MKYIFIKAFKKTASTFTKLLPFAYMVFIWYLSSKPSDAVVNTSLPYDKLLKESLHLIEFAALYILFIIAFAATGRLRPRTSKIAAVMSVLYGFVDEFHQYFVPCRSATVNDLLKDITGVLIAYLIINRLRFKKPIRHSR
ncbi:MAG: VanZ family protein [Desulfotomaculaceae bacterium]|nr:VanZ family protein [Desulfotomaculaceae bacterium]